MTCPGLRQVNTPAPFAAATQRCRGGHSWRRSSAVGSCGSSNPKQRLNLEGAAITDRSKVAHQRQISEDGQTAKPHPDSHEYAHRPLWLQHRPPPRLRVPVLGGKEHSLKGNWPTLAPNLRASAPATWDHTLSNRAVTATEQRGSPASHLALALPLLLQPHLPRRWLPAHL